MMRRVFDLVILPFHDWKKCEAEGFRTRDGHLLREFEKHPAIRKILVIDRPISISEMILKHCHLRTRGGSVVHRGFLTWLTRVSQKVYVLDIVVPQVIRPLLLRFGWWGYIFGHPRVIRSIKSAIRFASIDDFVLFLWSPMSTGVVGKLGEKLLAFDALDNWEIHPEVRTGMKYVKKGYDTIRDKSDIIFVNSQPLKEFLGSDREDVHCILNGVSPEHFKVEKPEVVPADLERIPSPRIGYAGKLAMRIDVELIAYMADKMPAVNFVFIGPILDLRWIKPLFNFRNIHFLGDKHYSELPAYLSSFDICMIPHNVGSLENQGDPIKLYEYLISGKPVVTTNILGVDVFEDAISIARTKEDFLDEINKYLALTENERNELAPVLRDRVQPSCFWENKACQMIDYIGNAIDEKEEEAISREVSKKGDLKIHLVFAPPVVMPKLGELGEGRIPPLGIMYLASYLREKIYNVEIKITDGLLLGFEETLNEIERFRPDILGISYYTASAGGAMTLADHMKARYPDILIVGGGPHATELPEESLNRSKMDVIVLGEGEVTFKELVDLYREGDHRSSIGLSEVNGIAFKEGERVRHTTPRTPISDLDSIPFPAP